MHGQDYTSHWLLNADNWYIRELEVKKILWDIRTSPSINRRNLVFHSRTVCSFLLHLRNSFHQRRKAHSESTPNLTVIRHLTKCIMLYLEGNIMEWLQCCILWFCIARAFVCFWNQLLLLTQQFNLLWANTFCI